jgi:hypothetical protein
MHGTPASIVTEIGRLRENVRGNVSFTVEAVDLVTVTYFTGTHTEHAVISGEHWDTYAKTVATLDRQIRRNRAAATLAQAVTA